MTPLYQLMLRVQEIGIEAASVVGAVQSLSAANATEAECSAWLATATQLLAGVGQLEKQIRSGGKT